MRLAEDRPWTRDQRKCGNGQTVRPKAKERRSERGNKGGTPTRTAQTPEWDGARERRGPTGRLPAPRSQKRPDDQTEEVRPGRGSHDQPRVRTLREGQGRSQTELKPLRELEDPTLMGTSKVSSRDGATGSDSNTDRSRGGRKANSPIETVQKRLNPTRTE